MTTSVFTQFDLIQYFASLDPYSYSVDNRPLTDLKQNIDVLARAHDAALDAAKLATVATGMVARGIVGENMMVGQKSIGSMNLVIDNGVFIKEGAEYGSDPNSQFFPKMGLQQQGVTFTLSTPGSAGLIKYFTISARFKAPDNSLSFYDSTNPNTPNSVELGTVEYAPIQSATVATPFHVSHFPTSPLGYYPLFHVAVPFGVSALTGDMITNVNFVDDLTRAYDSYSATTTGVNNIIPDITVNANYALVFINGVFQNPTTYDVDSPSQITIHGAVLPAGLTVDFVTLRGGASGSGSGTGTYSYVSDTYTTLTPAEDTFAVTSPLDSDYVFVFVNGVFQGDIDRTVPGFVKIPATVPLGTKIDFVQTIGGSGLPAGGVAGQSTHKSGVLLTDVWQNEVLSVNVNSASGSAPLAYVSAPINFAEGYDLYEGRQIVLVNNGGFTSVPTNGAITPTVTLQIGTLGALPVTRPGNIPLKNNDIQSGSVVTYRTSPTNHFELVSPAMPDIVSQFGLVTGTQNAIEVTPRLTMLGVQHGTIFSITPPQILASGNDQESCTLKVNLATGNYTALIVKPNGFGFTGLRPGDIQGDRNHLFQVNRTIGAFVLLNPANQPVWEVSGAKRQTVLAGPYDTAQNHTYDFVQTAGGNRSVKVLPGAKPSALVFQISGPNHYLSVSDQTQISFANGFDDKGPVDFVETVNGLTVIQDLNSAPYRGITSASISSVVLNPATQTITILYGSAVNTTISAGDWVRIRGAVGTGLTPLQGINGIFYVESANTTSVVLSAQVGSAVTATSGLAGLVLDKVYFAYANRDNNGAVTYGVTPYKPMYLRMNSEEFNHLSFTPVYGEFGQCFFDIDRMKMYERVGNVLLERQRVFLGEVCVPDIGTTLNNNFITTYSYNGKFTAVIDPIITPSNTLGVYNGAATYQDFNDFTHGLGTYMYDVKLTGHYASKGAGRAVGGLVGSYSPVAPGGISSVQPMILKKDSSRLSFTVPLTTQVIVGGEGYSQSVSGTFLVLNATHTLELERNF